MGALTDDLPPRRRPGREVGLAPADILEIAEPVIDWSDRISVAFSEGYNDESAARAGAMETRRLHLIELVLADTPPDAAALAAVAREAAWRPPARLRVLVARGPGRHQFRRRLPAGGVAADIGDELCALLPEPFSSDPVRAFPPEPGTLAALSPPVPLHDARHGAALSRRALALAKEGVLSSSEVLDSTKHELSLLVYADANLARASAARVVAPIRQKPEPVVTLASWLRSDGRVKASAAELDVHPHTVTYRTNRARELLGPVVDYPSRRLDLHLTIFIARGTPRRQRCPLRAVINRVARHLVDDGEEPGAAARGWCYRPPADGI